MADTPAVNKSQSNVVDDFLAALFASNPTPTMEKKPQNQPKSPQQETATITTTSTTSITPKQIDNDQQGGTAAAGTTKRAEILDEFDEYEMLSKRKHESKDSTANARKGGKAGSKPKKAAKKAWPEARLLVRGIPHTARKHDVLKHFNKYGNIVESHIGGNGIDYIQFDSPDSCTAALAENGTNIKGSAIELDIAANARPFIDYENSTQQHQQVPFRTGNKFSSRGGGNAHMGRGRGRGRGAGHFQPYSIQQQQQVPEYDPTDYSMWNGGYRENYSNQQQQQQQQPLYENNSYRGKRGGRQGMRGGGRGKPKGIMARQQHQRHSSPIPRNDSLSILQNRDAPMIQVLAYGHVDQGFINYVESSFAIRHITTHTLFVQYGQVSREEIVKQLILQGVRALVVLDQGKESMRKLYLQVFERNATGANSYRFDEYDSVSVDEAIAIIERSQQTNGQPPQSTSAATSTAQAAYQAQQLLMQQQQQQQQQQPLSTQAQAISNIDPNTLASVIGLLKNMVQPTTQQQQQQPAPAPVPVPSLGNPTYPSQQPMAQPNPAASLSQLQQLLGSALGTSFPQSSSNMTVPSAAPFNQIPTTFPSTQPSQHVPSPAYPPPQQQQQQPMTSIPTSAPNISVNDLLQKLQSFTQQQMQHQ
ncbi:hypothetical protein K492DRAFT_205317 [Lichtheimia hyalospora FSU 10163]|nr:hypothetical protein K492DRAFT_205317 [Lichtheimia hyalospora FSU 10163]